MTDAYQNRIATAVPPAWPVSAARAFAAGDWRHLSAEGGIPAERACIEWFFPFRYSVSCRKEI
jgi:hypothetical protein